MWDTRSPHHIVPLPAVYVASMNLLKWIAEVLQILAHTVWEAGPMGWAIQTAHRLDWQPAPGCRDQHVPDMREVPSCLLSSMARLCPAIRDVL